MMRTNHTPNQHHCSTRRGMLHIRWKLPRASAVAHRLFKAGCRRTTDASANFAPYTTSASASLTQISTQRKKLQGPCDLCRWGAHSLLESSNTNRYSA
ncbi:hypothetical protein WG66_005107 [Moniliophthora roreri]|nr:hypothetical protein WG66_005107 [Moniliophthora roreri]